MSEVLTMRKGPAELWCQNCGSVGTIAQLRSEHPAALSCCPERSMITIDKIWFKLPQQVRRQWWAETDYGKRPPSKTLIYQAKIAFEQRT